MPTRTIQRAPTDPPIPPGGARAAESVAPHIGSAAPFTDRPFGCPLDTVIDVPVPPSVNDTRRVNWSGVARLRKWKQRADMMLMASGQYRRAQKDIERFEIVIVLCETLCRLDLDNAVKHVIDYLRQIKVIRNDNPRCMRKVTIEWGLAPAGCRLIVKPIEGVE